MVIQKIAQTKKAYSVVAALVRMNLVFEEETEGVFKSAIYYYNRA